MTKRHRIRLVLVDDHVVLRTSLRALLDRCEDIDVVDEAGSAALALTQVLRHTPDVVLLDIKLPDRSGIELCDEIRTASPKTRVIFLTALSDHEALHSSVIHGADGYLHKTTYFQQLVEAIKSVAGGNCYLDGPAASSVMAWLKESGSQLPTFGAVRLSPQEQRIVGLVADGLTNKEIALALGLSAMTVKNYLAHVFDKLGITRRAQASAIFTKHNLTQVPASLLKYQKVCTDKKRQTPMSKRKARSA